MTSDEKASLLQYLRSARAAVLWKLDGLAEDDQRRPLVATGTNLLGLVKHLAFVEAGYFGTALGRPVPQRLRWDLAPDADATADMWATAEESPEDIVAAYRKAADVTDAVVEELPLDAPANVPWWPADRRATTLRMLLITVLAETNRHAGHADIVRELIDGSVGLRPGSPNVPDLDEAAWAEHRRRLEELARARGEPGMR